MGKSPYSLCFKGCIRQANQNDPRKIQIIIVNVTSHVLNNDKITISFNDTISCQMARDILGDQDWHSVTDTTIYGTFKKDLGYKIQNHYFHALTVENNN